MKTRVWVLVLSLAIARQLGAAGFELRSSAVTEGSRLSIECTGDGAGESPPLEWTGPPAGTRAYALIMHHVDPEGKTKWYWTLFNIPGGVSRLERNAQKVGILGNNSVNGRCSYAPPHSKGPGDKTYVLTVYALSETVQPPVPPTRVTREVLLSAMEGKILGTASLSVVYARPGGGSTNAPSAAR